jgi:uncharacterized protein (DUF983 family)
MIKKGTKIYSILKSKCPACHEGDFFISHPYDLSKAGDLHKNCSECNQLYSKEPGFYFGAMYISYGITVGLSLCLWIFKEAINYQISILQFIFFYAIFILLLTPYIYALSKIMWANIFIHYQSNK